MMERRRALMSDKADPTLLFSLKSYQIVKISLSTEVKFISNTSDRTIVIDIYVGENPSSGDGNMYKLARSWSGSAANFYVGKTNSGDSILRIYWAGKIASISNSNSAPGRKRLVLTHEANKNTVQIYAKMDDGTLSTTTLDATYASSGGIFIGGGGGNCIKSGMINRYEIYDRILTAKEIDKFFV